MIRKRKSSYVGIMVRQTGGSVPFSERTFFRNLCIAGKRLGVKVYVFSPEWINWSAKTVRGYVYSSEHNGWQRKLFPYPSLIYDRAFFKTRAQLSRHKAQLSRLLKSPGVKLLGLGLSGKLDVYRILADDPTLKPSLPPTEKYKGRNTLEAWVKQYGTVIVKPHGGTHGRGVFRLGTSSPGRFEAVGRNGKNEIVRRQFRSLRALSIWADSMLIKGRSFLVQQYLPLTTDLGAPFDIRALVQKNGAGEWTITGTAARVGPVGSITSNLHGGGRAVEAESFLIDEYGVEKAADILQNISVTALAIPPVLESRHGPLLELGIDFGVDRLGRVWVLEVNSKPGRSSFAKSADKKVRVAAIVSPIYYANYVLNRHVGGHRNELDA